MSATAAKVWPCRECGTEVSTAFSVGQFPSDNRPLCEPCADRMVACAHEEGTRLKRFDSDGCGFLIWRCDACGLELLDDMP